jgi:uncharacterized membrane protein HdeD (DUF308 family)
MMTESRKGPDIEDRSAVVPDQASGRHERVEPGETRAEQGQDLHRQGGLPEAVAGKTWGALLFGAVCMLAAGVVVLVWPNATLLVAGICIGLALIGSGLVKLYEGFSTTREESGGMRAAHVVIGLLAILAGVYLLRHHALSVGLIAFLTGVYFIVHGISDLGVAFSGMGRDRPVRALLGVFSLFAGIIMVAWPALTLVLLVLMVGAWLLFYGLMLAFLAFTLRRAAKEARTAQVAPSAPQPTSR